MTYDGIVARIVRANIECTNGYIHLIDRVVMKVGKLINYDFEIRIRRVYIYKRCHRNGQLDTQNISVLTQTLIV